MVISDSEKLKDIIESENATEKDKSREGILKTEKREGGLERMRHTKGQKKKEDEYNSWLA